MNTKAYITIIIASIIVFLIIFLIVMRIRKNRAYGREFDLLEGHEFEYYCADLLMKRGFQEVEVTRGSGDYGIDILAERDGVTYAIQCKCYSAPVGVKAVQEAYAGRDYYDCMVGAVLTNQYFTQPAVEAAKKLKILLWDRGYLESMIEE
ncbi:MAG: restriction endonuclease [Lachnospiraceae bacterium]|nr:restriction endonuclease [Lachnospiraceae bacterium]